MDDHTEYEGFTLVVEQDVHPDHPEEWGDPDFFLGKVEGLRLTEKGKRAGWDLEYAAQYLSWGEGPWDFEEWEDYCIHAQRGFGTAAELKEEWEGQRSKGYQVFPVRFNGERLVQCEHAIAGGYVFIAVPVEELKWLALVATETSTPEERVGRCIEIWNQYITGDVWMAYVYDDSDEIIESTGSVYGYDEAVTEAKEMADECKDTFTLHHFVALYRSGVWLKVAAEVPRQVGKTNAAAWVIENTESTHGIPMGDLIAVIEEFSIQNNDEGVWGNPQKEVSHG
jgi:hypothetical protein